MAPAVVVSETLRAQAPWSRKPRPRGCFLVVMPTVALRPALRLRAEPAVSSPLCPANADGITSIVALSTRPRADVLRPWVAATVTVMTSQPDRAGRKNSNRMPPGWNTMLAWAVMPSLVNRGVSCA